MLSAYIDIAVAHHSVLVPVIAGFGSGTAGLRRILCIVLMTLSVDILPVIDMGILPIEDVLTLRIGTDQHAAVRFAVDRDGAPRVAVLFPMGISALFTDLGIRNRAEEIVLNEIVYV